MSLKTLKRLPQLMFYAGMIAVTTILVCFLLATFLNHYPTELFLPFISLTGYKAPERYLYALGFGSAGVLFLYCSYYIHYYILSFTNLFTKQQISRLFYILSSGVVFFMIHAFIPLQDDIITTKTLTIWSTIHQSSAGVFFMLVLLHTSFVFYYTNHNENTFIYFDERATKIRKHCALGCGLTVVLAMVVHPTTVSILGKDSAKVVSGMAALAQWILVGLIILIFVSYSMDVTKILPRIAESETETHKERKD
ncbi:hypothetical protein EIN_408830 [Entamoeba invadens IP1]|uniref:CWH43-like N-terminal domain-containing protein n=1 Tax=Entamoeba invadens IP1 TaxID=370355 RepID=A0A0A1TWL5_ENTIV|nr:hypothetical protein EIN_408830 [Entamoeba invadens IP1]ELP85604.1 hypothetical protein EIN_408830 [Entamoeba invadens IP1]|eukprot:XP_004184950.1 hypothetical protein EIN_408830 [Entamoeba invadens IP1]